MGSRLRTDANDQFPSRCHKWMDERMVDTWFLVQFKPNAHNVADRNLKRQGFATFLPMQEITRRQGGRFVSELRPLFPGYMFIRLDPETSPWRQVNSTYGVTRIVSFADRPAPVPPALVDGLLRRCDERGQILSRENLGVGDAIKVIEGPFSEFVGTVESIDADQRVWLLLELMGHTMRIQLNASQIVSQ
jgi:transcriptional antiterminator RfaH